MKLYLEHSKLDFKNKGKIVEVWSCLLQIWHHLFFHVFNSQHITSRTLNNKCIPMLEPSIDLTYIFDRPWVLSVWR